MKCGASARRGAVLFHASAAVSRAIPAVFRVDAAVKELNATCARCNARQLEAAIRERMARGEYKAKPEGKGGEEEMHLQIV